MKKGLLLVLLALSVGACNRKPLGDGRGATAGRSDDQRPNIIVILIDDAGYVDFGFMGSEDLETPQIDRLAREGVVFTDAHVSSTVCAPSRAGLMTGRYQQRFGFEANGTGFGGSGDIGLADEVTTLADVFQRNGYRTIAIGKWHLGGTASDHPNQRGFDEFYGFIGGSRSYFPLANPSPEHMLQHNGERVTFEGYLTDVLGDRSVRFVEENQDRPFFMYLAFNAVHTPMEARESLLARYQGHPRQYLAAMTWSLDENIGRLRNKLRDLDLLDNTLIYFLSDNGGAPNNESSNGPLKGWKGNEFEGGHRVPFVMSWPAGLEGGRTFAGLSSSLDIFTTSLAAAGIAREDTLTLDGVNLLPYLRGERSGDPHDELYWRKLEELAARMGDHKLVQLSGYGSTLYDLSADLGERNDLSAVDTLAYQRLLDGLAAWESRMHEPLWLEARPWMDVTYYIQRQLMNNQEVKYKSPAEKDDLSTD